MSGRAGSKPLLLLGAAMSVLTPSVAPAQEAGPCAQDALTSIVDRPGLGRPAAVNGSPCVPAPGEVVLEAGYRTQTTTANGTSTLATYPTPVVRLGLPAHNEIVVSPSLIYSQRRGANLGGTFVPVSGMQDAGIGVKHGLRDRVWAQDAVEFFVTVPTGYPTGPFGFSAGTPAYLLGYSLALPVTARLGVSTTQNVTLASAAGPAGAPQRFTAYQPSLGVSYALSARANLLLQEQLTLPAAPGGGAGNRALAGLQLVLSPAVVADIDVEANLLPAPGFAQHAFGAGFAIRL